jgi:hypothetical protein
MGKAFGVEWICTMKLPFLCTRGLRNPWNANREVCLFKACKHFGYDSAVLEEIAL